MAPCVPLGSQFYEGRWHDIIMPSSLRRTTTSWTGSGLARGPLWSALLFPCKQSRPNAHLIWKMVPPDWSSIPTLFSRNFSTTKIMTGKHSEPPTAGSTPFVSRLRRQYVSTILNLLTLAWSSPLGLATWQRFCGCCSILSSRDENTLMRSSPL